MNMRLVSFVLHIWLGLIVNPYLVLSYAVWYVASQYTDKIVFSYESVDTAIGITFVGLPLFLYGGWCLMEKHIWK